MKDFFNPMREIATGLGFATKENMMLAETALKQRVRERLPEVGEVGDNCVFGTGVTLWRTAEIDVELVARADDFFRKDIKFSVRFRENELGEGQTGLTIYSVTETIKKSGTQNWGRERELSGRKRLWILEALAK